MCYNFGKVFSKNELRILIVRFRRFMKPGSKDKKIEILISEIELLELQRHTSSMAEVLVLIAELTIIKGSVL